MPIMICGKEYKTVAERLNEAHENNDLFEVVTEVLFLDPQVMVKATIKTKQGTFTGISAADPNKTIEAKTPVEVAETSAVGRALAFAGYAGSEIASVEELQKALEPKNGAGTNGLQNLCKCGKNMIERTVTVKRGTPDEHQTTILACPDATKDNKSYHSEPVWL